MKSVYNLCVLLIKAGKPRAAILEKMDVYLAADRLTTDEYNDLVNMLPDA